MIFDFNDWTIFIKNIFYELKNKTKKLIDIIFIL